MDASTGLYHFNSTLSPELKWSVEPTCRVKDNGISPNITPDCRPIAGNYLFLFISERMGLKFPKTTSLKALQY